ncbi:hypothetical protein BUALT_Bualt11G0113700 [Buddleja alternifolia]|uniref:Uncharacterized protein n=1 Tax=Buddleja alternifolia TaxID=168488 RepID=A0AAV6X1H2_9LAMI|nr:hypothetical protein BUALT_Bualt11G0113700 [Buddleja alternifolia]
MAMSYVIRKTSSPTMLPLALRAISISSARVVLPESGSFRSHQFSTAAVDQKLVKLLKSKIKSMERRCLFKFTESHMPATPADFPFKMDDYECHPRLQMELPGEKITVYVRLPSRVIRKEDDNNENRTDNNDNNSSTYSSDDEEEEEQKYNVRLNLYIYKEDGTNMEIDVLGSVDEIIVERIQIYEPISAHFHVHTAPKFKELARDVQYSIKDFIGVKGINKTNVEFLLKYMIRRPGGYHGKKNKLRFLKAFKKCVSQQVC